MITSTATDVRYSCDGCTTVVAAKPGAWPMITGWYIDPDGVGVLCPRCRRARKPPMHKIPMHAMRGVARVLANGDERYQEGDFRFRDLVEAKRMFLDSALRHMIDIEEHDVAFDDDTGAASLDHLIGQCLIYRLILQEAGALEPDPGPLRSGPVGPGAADVLALAAPAAPSTEAP